MRLPVSPLFGDIQGGSRELGGIDHGVQLGRFVDWARDTLKTTVEIVRKPADQRGFAVQPRRWVVERTLAWLTAHRRLARDYERHPEVSEAVICWAAINGMLRRITRGQSGRRQLRRTFTWT